MHKTPLSIFFAVLLLFVSVRPGSGLDGESMVRLKKAGIGDATIQVIVREKAIETAAFSVQEIVDMKTAGLSEETIRMVVKENSFLKNAEPIVYGKQIRSIRFTTVQDIIELKKTGVSDDVIRAIITVVGNSNESEREKALDLLESMDIGIIVRDR
jgi:hypothetical protein